MNKRKQIATILLSLGMIILLVVAALPLVGVKELWLRYVYACGAVFTWLARMMDRYGGKNIGLRRLYRIQTVSAVCYCISAALLFYSESGQDWLAFLTSGAVLQIYTSIRIQNEEDKEASAKGEK